LAHRRVVQKTALPGISLSDRVYRKLRKPGIKTLPQREPRGRKGNCSLSRHRHSPAKNAVEIAIQESGFIATREGAVRKSPSWKLHHHLPKTEGCRRIHININKHINQ